MKENGKKRKKLKDSFLTSGLSFLILLPMLFLMLPTVVFLFLSMLPTFIALIITSSKAKFKYKWLCVGGLNFAGSLPFLFKLWFGSNTLDGAINLFLGHVSFIIIYLAAAVGWIFYRCIPPVVLSFLEMSDQRRVVHLRELQTKLVAKWGEEVIEGSDAKTAVLPGRKNIIPPPPAASAAAASGPGDVKTPLS